MKSNETFEERILRGCVEVQCLKNERIVRIYTSATITGKGMAIHIVKSPIEPPVAIF